MSTSFQNNLLNQKGGIYIHIPFCKQACHYCNFHFSTSLKTKESLVSALVKEIALRKKEFEQISVETIYFGGGTPSLLNIEDIQRLLHQIYTYYHVVENPEITLEANPDDLTKNKIISLSKTKINRLSIGIQSFYDHDLVLMNRTHCAHESLKCLQEATCYFNNISIDLIYGIPEMTNDRWILNIQKALSLNIPHISAYALTVEPQTVLYNRVKKGLITIPKDNVTHTHFMILIKELENNNFVHYEISNFGKTNYFSKNNTAYWLGKKYIGIGPSAHSYNGIERSWNISNNNMYIKTIEMNKRPCEREVLSKTDQYNEYIMTGLRTIWGISLNKIITDFGIIYSNYLSDNMKKHIYNGLLYLEESQTGYILKTTRKGKFLTDGIASDLFYIS